METKALLIFTCSLMIMGLGPLIFFETLFPNAEEQQDMTQAVAPPATAEATAEQTPTPVQRAAGGQEMQHLFSIWNGACKPLEREVKKTMRDLKSYKHIKTRYNDYGDYLRVTMVFRSKNALGLTVINTIAADVDFAGKLSNIVGPEAHALNEAGSRM